MQEYNRIEDTEYISDAPSQLNKNMESIATDFSGASFPTENLFVGMKCLRTDENAVYRLYENASNKLVWRLEYTIVDGGIKVKQADDASSATKATNDKNGKNISTYVAKLEIDANNAFSINIYDGNNNQLGSVTIPETKVEIMTGASSSSAGKAGLVPAPSAGAKNRYLNAYGNFDEIDVPVKSVNGKTGDVVVGEVTDLSISGKTITLTFADGTTKTLTTQDTNTTYKPNWNGYVQKTGTSFTAPSNGMVYLWNGTASNKYASNLYVNGKQVGKHGVGNEGWTGQYGTLVAFVASGDVVSWSQSNDVCYFVPFV